jgi:outer membrane protein TolC
MNPTNRLALRGLCAIFALPGALLAAPALAQPAPAPAGAVVAAPPTGPAARAAVPDPLAIALAPQPGGLTPDEAGKIAAKTKHSVRGKQADLEAASAKVDQAFVGYFPRLALTATYTRLSNVPPIVFGAVTVPPILNSTSFVASLSIPVSDYILRVSQGYSAASHSEKGKRLELEAETLQAAADAKISYYNWLRAKGSVVVTRQAVDQSRAHVDDANKTFTVGLISKADVLRLEAQLAGAQQSFAETESLALLSEEQLRILLMIPAGQALAIGGDVMHEQAPAPTETLPALQDLALAHRLEIRALDETDLSLKETVNLARAGYLPRLDLFADATMANPNQRILLGGAEFYGTWDAGARLSWTLNDSFVAAGATAEAKARVASLAEQKAILRDGLRLEVTSAYADMMKSVATIEASERQLTASEESLRVRNELFKNGKATSVELVDAEAEVTRARLGRLNARIGLAVARVRLDHATGRDVAARPVTAAD